MSMCHGYDVIIITSNRSGRKTYSKSYWTRDRYYLKIVVLSFMKHKFAYILSHYKFSTVTEVRKSSIRPWITGNLIFEFCDLNLVKPGDSFTDFGMARVSLRWQFLLKWEFWKFSKFSLFLDYNLWSIDSLRPESWEKRFKSSLLRTFIYGNGYRHRRHFFFNFKINSIIWQMVKVFFENFVISRIHY